MEHTSHGILFAFKFKRILVTRICPKNSVNRRCKNWLTEIGLTRKLREHVQLTLKILSASKAVASLDDFQVENLNLLFTQLPEAAC